MTTVSERKLTILKSAGWTVDGVSIERNGERGLVTDSGMVHWLDRPTRQQLTSRELKENADLSKAPNATLKRMQLCLLFCEKMSNEQIETALKARFERGNSND